MLKDLSASKILTLLLSLLASIFLAQFFWNSLIFLSDVVLILFLAWLLSFMIYPLVDKLAGLKVPRVTAALGIYLVITSFITGIIFYLLPILVSQLLELSESLPFFADQAPKVVSGLEKFLNDRGVNVDVTKSFEQTLTDLSSVGLNTADRLVGFIGSFFNTLFATLLVLIISFYLVLDGKKLEKSLIKTLPSSWREEAHFFSATVNSSFAGFLRGQLSLALIWGFSSWIVLTIFGVSFASLTAILGAILMIIPVIGGVLGIIPPLFTVSLINPELFFLIFIILMIIQILETNILAPIIFERTVGLHPVLVLVSFLLGMKIGSWWGALFAVPVASILWAISKEVYLHLRTKYNFFQ